MICSTMLMPFITRPQVSEVAVLALPSEQWGQKTAAVIVLDPHFAQSQKQDGKKPWSVLDLRRALKYRLAAYKLPQEMRIVEGGLPRNAMGKGMLFIFYINNLGLSRNFFTDYENSK